MAALDVTRPLTPTGNLRRRQRVDRAMGYAAQGAALLALAVLGLVIYSVAQKGAGQLSFGFLTHDLPIAGQRSGGGIAPLIVGTLVLIGVATAMALPMGVLMAIYLTEFAPPRIARRLGLTLDLLNGIPSIVLGIFVFELIVVTEHHLSGFAGSCALAIIMLPLIARSAQEVLRLVPTSLRDGALALGASRWRTVVGIILPTALGGILTGTVLAVARAAGESAPLILVTGVFGNTVSTDLFGASVPNIPVQIFIWSESATPADHTRAWAAALVLMGAILLASLAAKALLARSQRKLTR